MFSRSFIISVLGAPLLALAQNANPFNVPSDGYSASAGQPLDLSWKPTTSGTVTLVLRSGSSNDLAAGTVIASNIDNSGSYTWTPSDSITRGSDYTIEIVDDTDPSNTNYTPYFVLDSPNTVAQSTGQVTLGSATASAIPSTLSSASPTGSATSVTAALSSSASASASSASGSASSGASASQTSGSATDSSASASMTSGSSMASASGSSARSSGMATSTTSGAGFQGTTPAGSSSAAAATQSTGAAPRIQAMAGVLGLAAVGAFAL